MSSKWLKNGFDRFPPINGRFKLNFDGFKVESKVAFVFLDFC